MRQQRGDALLRRSVNKTDRQGPTEDGMETKRVEDFNETPGPVKRAAGSGEEDKGSVCRCERIHLGNTELCIIYQTAVGLVLVFTLPD